MKPNIIIDEGKFKTTAAVERGAILLHADWPLGVAARDIEADEIIEYSRQKDTGDVIRPESGEIDIERGSIIETYEEIAKKFAADLERDYMAKRKYLEANYRKSIWLQCPPHDDEEVNFWQYGPEIPEVPGWIYPLADVWFNQALGTWVIIFPRAPGTSESFYTYPEFEKAQRAVELVIDKEYGERIYANTPKL